MFVWIRCWQSEQRLKLCEVFFFLCRCHLQLLDMKIFVDTDSDIRLVRRLRRDITERGRDIEGVIKQYNKFVKPAFEQYIEPTMRLADIVVPRGETESPPSLDLVPHRHTKISPDKGPPVFPLRWWKHGGHRSDCPTCSQPAGRGETLKRLCCMGK